MTDPHSPSEILAGGKTRPATMGTLPPSNGEPIPAVAWTVTRRTLHGGVQEGVQLIEINNGRLTCTLIPTRGMGIQQVVCGDLTLGWNSPVKQVVHPSFVDLHDGGGLGWLDGFNEMLVRCGVGWAGHPGEDQGSMLTLHGRIANTPARDVCVVVDEQEPYRIRVRGLVEEKRFKFGVFELWTEVSTVPGSNSLDICDRLVNRSEYDREYQMIYHANFGPPLLQKEARFVAAVKSVAPFDAYAARDLQSFPLYRGPTRDFGEQVYCLSLHGDDRGRTTTMLHNAAADRGVALRYQMESLPHFILWKNTDTETDGYVTGLEPATGFPYNRRIERQQGRVPQLAAGQEIEFHLRIDVLENAEAVASVQDEVTQLQDSRTTEFIPTPPM